MTQEMMGDAMDMALDSQDDQEVADEVVNQVLSEIGIDVIGQIGDAGIRDLAGNQVEEVKQHDDNLEARFAALK